MARKRWSRKTLKQPDVVQTTMQKFWDYVAAHAKPVLVAGGVAVLVLAAVAGWQRFSVSRSASATSELSRALRTYQEPLMSADAPAESTDEDAAKQPADEVEKFRTAKERAQATLKLLDTLDKDYPRSGAARQGALLRGSCSQDLGRWDDAAAAYRRFVGAAASDDPMRPIAYEGLGYALEQKGALDEALKQFRAMAPGEDHPMRDRALWHEARILERQGKTADARKRYEEILAKVPGTALREEINSRIAALP